MSGADNSQWRLITTYLYKNMVIIFIMIALLIVTSVVFYDHAKTQQQEFSKANFEFFKQKLSLHLTQYANPVVNLGAEEILTDHVENLLATNNQQELIDYVTSHATLGYKLSEIIFVDKQGRIINQRSNEDLDPFAVGLIVESSKLAKNQNLIDVHALTLNEPKLYYLLKLADVYEINSVLLVYDFQESLSLVDSLTQKNVDDAYMLLDQNGNLIAMGGKFSEGSMSNVQNLSNLFSSPSSSLVRDNEGIWFQDVIFPFWSARAKDTIRDAWRIIYYQPSYVVDDLVEKRYLQNLAFLIVPILVVFIYILIFRRAQNKSNVQCSDDLEAIPSVSYWKLDLTSNEPFYGPSLLVAMGYEPNEIEFINRQNPNQFVHAEDIDRVELELKKLLNQDVDEIDIDLRLRHKMGFWVWQNLRCAASKRTLDGRVEEISGIACDVSKRKQDEKILSTSLHETERSNIVKTDFIAELSSDVNTSITSILGFNQILLNSKVTPQQEKYIQRINLATKKLLSRIQQIITYSKLESGNIELPLTAVQLENLLENAFETVRDERYPNIKLHMDFDSSVGDWYMTDEEHLSLVIQLIIATLVEFTSNENIVIELQNNGRSKNVQLFNFILLSPVKNIQQSRLDKLLSLNEKSENPSHLVSLDLELVQKLLELMRSDLNIQINNEKELCISFELSLNIPNIYDRQKLTQAKDKEHQSTTFEKTFDLTNAKVLLVDDNATNREVILQILLSLGISADTAVDGLDAFNKVSANNYDLIFMDLQMPIMDGFESTQKIRNDLGLVSLPIIAVTANQYNIDRDKALERGLNDFIPKPVSAPQLKSCLEYWLGKEKNQKNVELPSFQDDKELLPPIKIENLLDIERFAKRFSGEISIQINIYKIFRRDFASWHATMMELIDKGDWLECERHAHTLKGAAANIDAHPLSDLAKRLEGQLKLDQPDQELILILSQEIADGIEQVVGLINDFMKSNVANDVAEDIVSHQVDVLKIIEPFKQLIDQRKRLPVDQLRTLQAGVKSTPLESTVGDFVEACYSFDYDLAKQLLSEIEQLAEKG